MLPKKLYRPLIVSGILAGSLGGLLYHSAPAPLSQASLGPAEPDWTLTKTDPDGPGPLPAGEPRIVGQLVLDLKDEASPQQVAELQQRYGFRARYNSAHSDGPELYLADVGETLMASLLDRLGREPLVEAVSPNYVFSLPEQELKAAQAFQQAAGDFPNDPMGKLQWHMDQINVKQAWPLSTGSGVIVSVIDTGVAYADHGEFRKLEDLENTGFVGGYDFVHDRPEAIDDHAHGSHVSGTVAQSTHNGKGVMGVAFNAKIMPIKVLSARGSGSLADIADGIYFSADHGAKVINMSLGGPFAESTLATAVRKAHQKGVIVVCAAGNSGAGKPGYPAGYPEAVSVSATDFKEELTFYSNRGPAIDIAAPGGDTRSDRNGDGFPDGVLQNTPIPGNARQHDYMWFMGTSMACPHVAGVSALVQSLGVTHPAAVERLLKNTARSKGPEGKEAGYGAGIVDAQRACWKAGIEYGAWRLGIGLALFVLPALAMLRRGYILGMALGLPTAVMAASGAFFLPLLMSSPTPAPWMLTTALPSWGLHLLGAQYHGNPLLFSCLVPVLLSLVVVDSRPLRAAVAGLSAGWAAHLFFAAFTGSVGVAFVPGLLSPLWLVANGLFLVFLSTVLGEEQP